MIAVHILKATGIAGAERHLLTLLPGLRARGIDARLILLHPPQNPLDTYAALLDASGVPLTRIPIDSHVDIGVIGRLRRALQAIQPDLVHTHLLHADLYGLSAALWARVPYRITTRHNDDVFRRRLILRLIHRLQWRYVVQAGIGISQAVTRFCVQIEHAPAHKMRTIYYGLPLPVPPIDRREARAALRAELKLPADAVLIGGAGRLTTQKGFTYALQAFKRIEREFPEAHLLIAGDGPLNMPLKAEARQLGLARRVHFLGWRTDIPNVLAGLDVFVMPSLWEGFGLVLLEAMAQALPVVGSAVSAIPEIVAHGETGLLVPPRDPDALADALRTLLRDPALMRHLGMLGEDRLERMFGADAMIEATAALYHEIVGAGRRT
jgi:glycosyltransferase involved in cell wall biosynthesis